MHLPTFLFLQCKNGAFVRLFIKCTGPHSGSPLYLEKWRICPGGHTGAEDSVHSRAPSAEVSQSGSLSIRGRKSGRRKWSGGRWQNCFIRLAIF